MLGIAKAEGIPFRVLLNSLGSSPATVYRSLKPKPELNETAPKQASAKHPRALSQLEVNEVVKVLNNEEFVDKSPRAIFNTLLDRGVFHCSVSTMYRILAAQGATAERRQIARARSFAAPE
jgi:putative transposase